MESPNTKSMIFQLGKFKCRISFPILETIPVLLACFNSACKDNRVYLCKLDITPEAVKTFFTWKQWEITNCEKPDFSQVTPKTWTETSNLASHLVVNNFFDTESVYYVLPSLKVMREELEFLVVEAFSIYCGEYLTLTHCQQCTCANRHITQLDDYIKRKFTKPELLLLEKTCNYIGNLLREWHLRWDFSSLYDIKEDMKKIGEFFSEYDSLVITQRYLNSRDNTVFVKFMESKEYQILLENALSFDVKYVDNVSNGLMYNFLQLDTDDRITIFDYFCYHNHFNDWEREKYKCKCDFTFHKKWNDFLTLDKLVAKVIFDKLDRDELLRATNITKKGSSIKKYDSFDQLVKFINNLAPQINTKNLSSDEKRRMALDANKKWNDVKLRDPAYLKASVQTIKIKIVKK